MQCRLRHTARIGLGATKPQGARFRALTVVDVFTKEYLAIEVEQSLKGEHVVAVLKRVVNERGVPKMIMPSGATFRAERRWSETAICPSAKS